MPNISDRIGSENVIKVLSQTTSVSGKLIYLTDLNKQLQDKDGMILVWDLGSQTFIMTSVIDTYTQSTIPTNGALVVNGGVGIGRNLNVGESLVVSGISTFNSNIDINSSVDIQNKLTVETLGVSGLTTTKNLQVIGVSTIGNIKIDANTIFTTTGNLTLNSISGITQIIDAVYINDQTQSASIYEGALFVSGGVGIQKNLNVGGNVDIDLDLNVDGGDITTNQSTFNLLNTTATTVNAFGSANIFNLGATTGIASIRNETLSVSNATTLNLGATSSTTSVNFQSTPNNSFVAIAATTNATTTTSGALRVAGGVGIVKDVYIGGILNVTGNQSGSNLTLTGNLQVDGNTTLGNASGDVVTITGSINHTGILNNAGGVTIDNIRINSNVISTKSGSGNVLYIDPYPDGLSNEGLVVVKGSLQVDGTTTTVDSSSVTVNGAIISLGDVTSNRTVVVAVSSGVSTITLDSIVGINTGDIISGNAALPNSGLTTITAYNTATKIVTIAGTTSSGISSTTQLTVTHAYDTNTDRGISFDYNTGVGTANQKSGFFGFDDSTGNFTYVPDASISNSVVSGVKGTLDVGALLLNFTTSGISTRGSAFFDANGKLVSTNTPEVGTASTSNLILTTNASNVPVWTDTLDGGTF